MEKMEIKLKECCLACKHFYLDSSKIGLMGCGPDGPRQISCLHMPVCGAYQADSGTLAGKSGGGGNTL